MKGIKEIEQASERANEAYINGDSPKHPSLSFEDGVRAALGWILGERDEDPTA
jgi:hypothetical protein